MRKQKGQSTLEYIAIIVIVIGALISVGNYFKRGLQGRWKLATDDLGDQYDPRNTNAYVTHTLTGTSESRLSTIPTVYYGRNGYWTIRTDYSNITDATVGNVSVAAD